MKLLFPIMAKNAAGRLRVIIIVESVVHASTRRDNGPRLAEVLAALLPTWPYAVNLARSYLEVVHEGGAKLVMVCNTAAPPDHNSTLDQARAHITAGDVDLIITTSLWQFSSHSVEVMEFLQFCVRSGARVISFEDHLDSADDGWSNDRLAESFGTLPAMSEEG